MPLSMEKVFNNDLGRASYSHARPSDLFGRWGGEEFLGIVRNITEKELLNLSERLRILVDKSYIHTPLDNVHVTISIGCTISCDNDSIKEVINRADKLLYQCKAKGRNRVEIG